MTSRSARRRTRRSSPRWSRRNPAERIEDAVADVLPRLRGAFSTVVITEDAVVAFRDPAGILPLVLGQVAGEYWCVASESCALDTIAAELVRDVNPGELVWIDNKGLHSHQISSGTRQAFCLFERINLARSDSRIGGQVVYGARARMARFSLARRRRRPPNS